MVAWVAQVFPCLEAQCWVTESSHFHLLVGGPKTQQTFFFNSMPGPEVIKTVFMLNPTEHKMKKFLALSLPDAEFILLILK